MAALHSSLRLAAFALLLSTGIAQRTWVVPSQVSDLATAVAAAAPGDVVRVVGGFYPELTVSKGIKLIESGSTWFPLVVSNVPANQEFVLVGYTGQVPRIQNCAGRVHVSRCWLGTASPPYAIHVQNCRLFTMDTSSVLGSVRVENSTALLTNVGVIGWDFMTSGPDAHPALVAVNADVSVSASHVRAGNLLSREPRPDVPGVISVGGVLRVGADCTVWGGRAESGAPSVVLWSPAVHSDDGVVSLHPDSDYGPGLPFRGRSTLAISGAPHLGVLSYSPSPAVFDTSLRGVPGRHGWICVSLPALPLPTLFGDLWLDVAFGSTQVLAHGPLDAATGTLTQQVDLSGIVFPGNVLTWQGVTSGPNGGLELSNPVVSVVRDSLP